jgi:hypothetical protein
LTTPKLIQRLLIATGGAVLAPFAIALLLGVA